MRVAMRIAQVIQKYGAVVQLLNENIDCTR